MSDRGETAVGRFFAKRDYRGADFDIVRRITAVAAFLSALVVAALSPLAPPDAQIGAVGWGILTTLAGGYALLGLRLLRIRDLRPDSALVIHVVALCGIAAVVWLSGGRDSPYTTLFLIWTALAGASHPPRRTVAVILAASLLAVLPLFYGEWSGVFAGDMALRLLAWSTLALMACAWTSQVRTQRTDLQHGEESAKRQARADVLTGLGNRRAFDERLDRAIEQALASGKPLSVIVADLDSFKEINDSYGHLNGDEVLRNAAIAMRAAVRDHDACYRWGGDEFAVLLPGVDQLAAERVAERVSSSIVATCTRPDGDPQTLAWGTAELTPAMKATDLLASADLALMTRKHQRHRGTSRFRADTSARRESDSEAT